MLQRPWRWLIALVVAAIVIGLLNQAGMALGASEYLGIGTPGRLAIYAGAVVALCAFVLPSQEKLDRGDPLPPLPDINQPRPRADQRLGNRQREMT
jgi:hypothetical protein